MAVSSDNWHLQANPLVARGDFLELRGARLYFEVRGAGPLVVLVTGAAGSVEPYRMLAGRLESQFTVVTYDRRGFSRSTLIGDQDYDRRLETDADDVCALIEHLSGASAAVFGNSSGAVVALEALVRHPSVVRVAAAHEPPVMTELPDADEWMGVFSSLYTLYRNSGAAPAMDHFREASFPESDRRVMAGVPANEFSAANATYWFEHELRQYPAVSLDHQTLRRHSDRVVLLVGSESRGFPCYEATLALGGKIGRCPAGTLASSSRPGSSHVASPPY
jgi:acetyltransferase/esterase